MNKTIWNPGDIITTEKWNKIKNNIEILGAYQLPITVINSNTKGVSGNNITIHKSYYEIFKLLQQGVICYYFLSNQITYVNSYDNNEHTIFTDYNDEFYETSNGTMTNYRQEVG